MGGWEGGGKSCTNNISNESKFFLYRFKCFPLNLLVFNSNNKSTISVNNVSKNKFQVTPLMVHGVEKCIGLQSALKIKDVVVAV